ncbi:hypothetical protein, partial [Mesorhizobium sp. M6A.T.Cr.TU.017.01.1.1]|uniref:hypothetical protein n=1 Tax=Mesorhizobium sp. M6A.T.Cr.TU.017.01.1.1 TaxID=2496774 RepID=UPI0013E32DAD
LDLRKPSDLSLFFLCIKLKHRYIAAGEPLRLFLDQGRRAPGVAFGNLLFKNWPATYSGVYESSSVEPLLQVADFLAFCINRLTHLGMKGTRTQTDMWFIETLMAMNIISEDLSLAALPSNFTVSEFDKVHKADRKRKGLED